MFNRSLLSNFLAFRPAKGGGGVQSPSLPDSVVSGACFFLGGGCMRLSHIYLVLRPHFVLMLDDRSSVFQREEPHCIIGCDASELFHNGLDLLKVRANSYFS